MWMTSCPEAMSWDSWVFWKKQFVEIWDKTKWVGIRIWARPVQLICCGMRARLLGLWVESWRWTNSQHSKNCVSLSPRVENLKVRKVIKVSYLNQESRQCFGIPMHVNVFTYQYISRIRIMVILHKDRNQSKIRGKIPQSNKMNVNEK